MLPYLQIGPLSLPVPALALLVSIWLGLELAEKHAHKHGLSAAHIYSLIVAGIAGAVIGARLSYLLTYPSIFLADPLSIVSPSPALLDPWGGVSGASLAAFLYGQRRGLPLWPALDAMAPFLAVVMVGTAVMHLASGDAFGAPTHLPWGIWLWGETRHPAQIYELTAALGILVLWKLSYRLALRAGQTFLGFIALSSLARVFLEAFRGDSVLLPGGLRVAQVAAWVLLAVALMGFRRRGSTSAVSAAAGSETSGDRPIVEN